MTFYISKDLERDLRLFDVVQTMTCKMGSMNDKKLNLSTNECNMLKSAYFYSYRLYKIKVIKNVQGGSDPTQPNRVKEKIVVDKTTRCTCQ